MAETGLVLRHCPYAPSGILPDSMDPVAIIADSMGRARQGLDDERDRQVTAAVAAAMAQLRRDAPALADQLAERFQTAALATSQQVMDAALRRAATALLQAEPWLSERVVAASRGAGAAGAESGLAAFAQKAWPYGVAALIVGVAAYGIATAGRRR